MDFHVHFVGIEDSSFSSLENCKEYLKIALCPLPENKAEFETDKSRVICWIFLRFQI